jgi:hypothetical protein
VTDLSEVIALVEDVVKHDPVEGGLLQEEVHAYWCVVADVKLADLQEAPAVA